MTSPSQDRILDILQPVIAPQKNVRASGVTVVDGHATVILEVPAEQAPHLESLRVAAQNAVASLPDITTATVILTAQRPAAPEGSAPSNSAPSLLPHVRSVIAVASGKGGVGKSTTAVNLALALSGQGLRVGILDADIYGPSIPRLLGIAEQRPESSDGKIMSPLHAHGIACMSIGFLIAEELPLIWRGPMVMGALEQLLRDTLWGDLDILVVDMPPGTGDAHLTLTQKIPLSGVVIVSTPQDIALIDARRGLNMFRKVNVPILGIVENMSYYTCPQCGHEAHIFGHGGAEAEALRLDAAFLGAIPLDLAIRTTSDKGDPIVISFPDSSHSKVYHTIAQRIREQIPALRKA